VRRGHVALALAAAAAGILAAEAAGVPRPYTLSLEVTYGDQPDRRAYLEEIRRSVGAWIAETGPLDAPTEPEKTDLTLRVVVNKIEVKHNYPQHNPQPDVFADTARPSAPQGSFSTLFETEVTVFDPRAADAAPLFKQPLSVFNEQMPSELITDPKGRSWQVNLDYLNDRLGSLLGRHRRTIERYLKAHGRTP
jgi:hypothetical protein